MSETSHGERQAPPEPVTAVILAGGLGTRIRHLLGDRPKPMVPVAGRPFIEWIVRYLTRQGVQRVILSTGYRAEVVEAHFRSHPVSGVQVSCVPEPRPLGTAGGFLHAVHATSAPRAWLVLNGDSLGLAPLAGLWKSLDRPGVDGAILGVRMPDASRYGTLEMDPDGRLARFREKQSGAGIINAGVYLFRTTLLPLFPQLTPLSFETDVFPALMEQNIQLDVRVEDAPFLDIGTPESLALAESFVIEHRRCFEL
jgi:NDP-sugar pyrophosphorylase family protein